MDRWKEIELEEYVNVNPRISLSKHSIATKVAMECVEPFSKRIARFETDEYKGGVKFCNGDTLMARITPSLENGKTAKVDILKDNEIGFGSTEFIVLRAKNGKTDPDFVYYLAISPELREVAIQSMTGSSGRQRVQTEVVKQLPFLFPPLTEQKAIAEVLSSLDDKIDLLHRQNKTLEAMAETLFRQWFVEEADESWEDGVLYDAIDLVGGGTPKTSVDEYWNGKIKWLSGGDISNNHKSIINTSEKTITDEGLNKSSAKLLPKYSTVISARGTVGKYCILSEPMAYSQSNYGIKPKYGYCYFFTYLLIDHCVNALNSAAYGSVFDTITTRTFKSLEIKIPSETEIVLFDNSVKDLFVRKSNNCSQIQTLTNLRNTLLPKLMSGEVRVKMN